MDDPQLPQIPSRENGISSRPDDAELQRRAADLAVAQTLARLGQWEWDLAANRITWSPEMVALVGCDTPPTTFDEIAALLGPECSRRVRRAVDATVESGAPFDIETPLTLEDGRIVHLHSRARLVRSEDGSPSRLLGMSQDITEQKARAAALELSEARYRALLEQIDDVVYSIDREGRFTTISGAFERTTGYDPSDWIGRAFTDLLDGTSVAEALRNFSERLVSRDIGRAEYVVKGRDAKLTVEVSNAPFFVDGELVGIVGVARDITSWKVERETAEREKRIASLGNLAASAAHEFNNVLMSIMPFAELMRRLHGDEERVRNATEHIMTAVRRGRQISQQILRLSRPANPSLGPVDMSAWLRAFEVDTRAALRPRYELIVTNECPGASVIGDRALIDQTIANLITNAREAMPGGGEISVRLFRAGAETIAVDVTDRGEGIAPEQLEHVFDPLFTTRHGSAGLGLTVAHQAMSLQGGMLRVDSRIDEGATFTMLFREAPAPAEAAGASDSGSLRVLLVEDEEAIAVGIGMLLETEGMEVRIASKGADVIPLAESFAPDVIILDVSLPDTSGVDVHEQVRKRWPSLPVIFSTGHREAAILASIRERGLPIISKPYDLTELLAIIRRTLDR